MNDDFSKQRDRSGFSRRSLLKLLGAGGGALALLPESIRAALPQRPPERVQTFTGPGANPHWNSVGPFFTEPQKDPLILLTDRPVQLETPRHLLGSPFTPNSEFYVRWHLDELPNAVDLSAWRLRIEGNVEKPFSLSMADLMKRFKPVSIAAANQCSGNSRSRFQPRVPGGQWGNGAMGNALWTGVPLKELLDAAGVKSGSVQVQFDGLDQGKGTKGLGSYKFLKSLDLNNPVLAECLVAYTMNGEPLPLLNGFPARLVVPGYFATYWVKSLAHIRVLEKPDENFWMKTGYRVPDTPRGTTTPEEIKAGTVKTIPIGKMPVRSFLISPDGSTKIPEEMPVTLRGIAFSGYGRVTKVEISTNDKDWREARLGEDYGPYSFRTWDISWTPPHPGRYSILVRATDEKGNMQPDEGVWNPGGYLWNKIEREEFVVGTAT